MFGKQRKFGRIACQRIFKGKFHESMNIILWNRHVFCIKESKARGALHICQARLASLKGTEKGASQISIKVVSCMDDRRIGALQALSPLAVSPPQLEKGWLLVCCLGHITATPINCRALFLEEWHVLAAAVCQVAVEHQLQTLHLSCYVMMYPHKVWMLTHHFERWAMGIGIDIRWY